jgi:Flp pilus assembly secretin CpaC
MLNRLRSCALGLLLLLAASASEATEQTIKLALGAGYLLTLDAPFESVLIGDPNIIAVTLQTDRTVILKGVGRGTANVVFLDWQSVVIANIGVVVVEAAAARSLSTVMAMVNP